MLNAGSLLLGVLDRSSQAAFPQLFELLVLLAYAVMGAVVARRQPRNPIGWLYLAIGFATSLNIFAEQYAVRSLVADPGSLPYPKAALWLGSPALDSLFILVVTLVLLLFPNGRPLTRRWRFAVWIAVAGAALGLSEAFVDYPLEAPLAGYHNPLLVTGAAGSVIGGLYQVSGPLLIGSFFAGIACVALRFRRSRGIERQQLKWFAAAVMTVLAVIVVVFAAYQATGRDYSDAIFLIGTSIIPVATGLAMLRYRLYEIDVIIRRTVVYAALIAALAALYLGGVALLGWIFRSVTGQSGALAVTLSTLLVAAAFQPLRPGSSARSITASIAASTTPQ